jgi:hypothetical protein
VNTERAAHASRRRPICPGRSARASAAEPDRLQATEHHLIDLGRDLASSYCQSQWGMATRTRPDQGSGAGRVSSDESDSPGR